MPVHVSRPVARLVVAAALSFAVAPAAPALAQSVAVQTTGVPADTTSLKARQEQLFEQLLREPQNLDLMFEYAQVSIRLKEYEPAISTLERMLIYRQDLPRVRLELAVAYFNLGSYEVSKLYFEQVLADPNVPDEVQARVQPYLNAIAERTKVNSLSVVLSAGLTYSTNATLGPESDQILLNGNLATLNTGQSEDDFGARTMVNVTHTYDLQQPDDDYWRTDFSFFSLTYFDTTEGDVYFTRFRTGPRLSLDNEQYGPKLRPYFEAQYLNAQNDSLFGAFGVGAELTNTLTPQFTLFGDYGARYRNYFHAVNSDDDTYNLYAMTGLAYSPTRDFAVRGTTIVDVDSADQDYNSNLELGLRVSADYLYEPPVEFVDRKWQLSTFSEVRHRMFEANDPIIGANCCRRDWDFRAGISHYFAIKDGFGVQLDVDGLLRDSNIRNFDISNVSTTLSLQYRM